MARNYSTGSQVACSGREHVSVDSNRLYGRIRVPPRVRLISPASAVACHLLYGMEALAGVSHGLPLGAVRSTASSPQWWDWPQSELVAAGRPHSVFQFGSRQCQVGGCHSTFQCRRLRRTIVLPARMRQFCVFSFNCASRLAVLSLCRCGLSVGCCWHARS